MVSNSGARAAAVLLAGTMLSGMAGAANAQSAPPRVLAPVPQATPDAAQKVIKSLRVLGTQRIEPDTVLSYTKLRVGQNFNNESLDQAIKDLLNSDLFADVTIDGRFRGTTPLSLKLPARETTVRIERQGYAPWEKRGLVPSADMRIQPALMPVAQPGAGSREPEAEAAPAPVPVAVPAP